jgi:hypothetical protein
LCITGNLDVGTGDVNFWNTYSGNTGSTNKAFTFLKALTPTSASQTIVNYLELFKINNTGNATLLGTLTQNSDYRLKENIVTLDENHTIDDIRPVEYTMKDDKAKKFGVIAHELQEIYPNLVNGEKDADNFQSVNYIGMIPLLINEIKMLKERVTELENKNNL